MSIIFSDYVNRFTYTFYLILEGKMKFTLFYTKMSSKNMFDIQSLPL